MACIEQKTDFNFLNWHKVVGSYTLSDLQANGVPSVCDNITEGWNISTVTFLQYFDASNEITNLRGVFFKPDGLKMYLLGVSNDRIYQYTLSSAWDVSTLTYDSISLDISPKDSAGSDMYFTEDGLKMYFIGSSNDKIYEYDLGTAWNISTGVFNQDLSVTSDESVPLGLYFKPTGLKMYICGINGDEINEYDLGTAWDISTAVLNQTKNISAQDTDPRSIFFKPNGLKMYMSGTQNDKVYEYDLSIAWDISTLLFTQSTDISAQGNTPWGLFFNSSGEKMYVAENQNTRVNEYDLTD